MNVLMLTPYLPYPLLSGGQIRTYNLLKQLAKHHNITLFALIKDNSELQYVSELEKYCSSVRVFKRSKHPFTLRNILKTAFSSYPFLVIRNYVPSVIGAIRQELKTKQYDLIHAETFYMMPHLPKTSVPTLLVEQTIEYLGYESYAKKAPWYLKPFLGLDIAKIKYWEEHFWKTCQELVVMSSDDQAFIAKQLPDHQLKTTVVENGVDTQWFSEKNKVDRKKPTVLSVGTFKWLPNVEAVTFLVEKVWPQIKKSMPEAQLHIVGNAPTQKVLEYQKQDASIKVFERVEDIRDAFAGADVLLAPVFSGKGTRYKVLEAMASGTPVVATSTAVEGLAISPGIHAQISDTAEGLAAATTQLLKDPQKRASMAHASQKLIADQYDWELISTKLDTLYKRMGQKV